MAKEVMMSMRMAPEAGADLSSHPAGPAPTQVAENNYSSNYKGVMLCDRPGIEVSRTANEGGHMEPFLTAVNAPEQLGLNPIKKSHPVNENGKPVKPKNQALSNHKRWLHSLGQLKKELAEDEEQQRQEEADKKAQLAEDSQKVRDHIRQIKRAAAGIDDVQGPASARAIMSKEEMLSELKSKHNKEVVDALYSGLPDDVTKREDPPKPPSSAKAVNKPAWARTAEEEEENEDAEVEDLLAFAEDLDIDQYMDDCEFREALAAAKARISELESDDEDAMTQCTERTDVTAGSVYSTMSAALRAKEEKAAKGQEDWDGSVAGKSEKSRTSRMSRAVAAEMLEMNPNLRQKHSQKSLAEIVEKRGFDPDDHEKFGRCGAGAVKVAVHTEENRLHRHGEVTNGKDLPYLYRNPAV